MQSVISVWQALDGRKRAIVVGATLGVFLAVLALARIATNPGMALLYAGLDGPAAGEIVAALEQQDVVFEIKGDSIYVEEGRRDALRMVLAGQGLPANSGSGYELLDGLSGFGTTSQMFDAAYWRAKEGELARTIMANPQIRQARVHIAQSPTKVFQRDQRATASVSVTTAGGGISPDQARALRHLVAAAVPGMIADDVAVIDTVAGLIPGDDETGALDRGAEAKSAEIRRNVERLLEARVGPGRAIVEVSVDVVTEQESITERTFDPQGRVAISQESEQRSGTATDPGGQVTVASNLPEGDAAEGAAGKSENSETRERVNYEVSETQREILRSPGAIRKLSVAVLVDGEEVTGADGSLTIAPRPEEELAVLRELVASAAGIDEARGDSLTIKSLAFRPSPTAGEIMEAGLFSGLGQIDLMSILQSVILGLVALILGLFVIRPILISSSRRPAIEQIAPPLALPGAANGLPFSASEVLTGEIDDGPTPSHLGPEPDPRSLDPVDRLRRLIAERQVESVEILRGWMELDEERR